MKKRHLLLSFLVTSFLLLSIGLSAQSSQELKVTDESGQPLIGVYVVSQQVKTVTDHRGLCMIPIDISEVSFSYLGYHSITLTSARLQELNYVIAMQTNSALIEEIVVVGRTTARDIEQPYKIHTIKAEDISTYGAQTSADALELNGGAFVQKSQAGGGSPVLRGFEANKVLLVVDGVRLNNAIYRNGHLQNAITIDPSILERVDIIFGAGSLLYGSEALGGVVHYTTQSPQLNFDDSIDYSQGLNAYIRYNSSNNENTYHADYSIGGRRLGSLTSVSYSKFGDLKTGSRRSEAYSDFGLRPEFVRTINGIDSIVANPDPNIQIGTAYTQFDVLQKFVYKANEKVQLRLNAQYSTSSDVPRYDNLSEYRDGVLRFADWRYGPQDRLLISPSATIKASNPAFDETHIILSYQQIEESRISRSFENPIEESQIEDVSVFGVTVDFKKRFSTHHNISYGLDYHYNDVNSVATGIDVTNGNTIDNLLTRYPSGGSTLSNAGAYIKYNIQNKDSTLVLINGLRYTYQDVSFSYLTSDPVRWPAHFIEGISNKTQALVGVTALNYQHDDNWRFKVSTGTSFRSPNVDDLAKIRINRDEITVPNPDLGPERVWNNEVSIDYVTQKAKVGITGYYTALSDALFRSDFQLPDGSSTFISGTDTLLVTANVNGESGSIRGLSLGFGYDLAPALSFQANINFQSGTLVNDESEETPLAHIPPTFGEVNMSYFKETWGIKAVSIFNGWKRIEDFGGSVDNPDLATIDGSPSWIIFDLVGYWHLNSDISLNYGFKNILDTHYRKFSSGVSSAGRHVSLTMRYSI